METFLRRTYQQKLMGVDVFEADDNFPFWDYRSRRGSLSTSCSLSSKASSLDDTGISISSLSSVRSADSVSTHTSSLSSDSGSVMVAIDPCRIQLQFLMEMREIVPMMRLYQSIVDWIDSDLRCFGFSQNDNKNVSETQHGSSMTNIAIMLFLSEDSSQGCGRIHACKRQLEKYPWKFHHSEQLVHGQINPYPFNSPDYFYTSEELPLWAVRLVHCGKESVRIVLFASDKHWESMINFYKLVIGDDPTVNKDNFCMFTVSSRGHYDIQFALKRLHTETCPRNLNCVRLKFSVPEVGALVALLPNVCKPVSDNEWETKDHDGNIIIIEVTRKTRPKSSTPLEIQIDDISRTRTCFTHSGISSGFKRQSVSSRHSAPSLTSVTSTSSTSSMSSSLSSEFREQSKDSDNISQERDTDVPPAIPPRVPINKKSRHRASIATKSLGKDASTAFYV